MKKLILHVGLHKTATSSIQASLEHNSELLLESGILFPTFEGLDGLQRSNHSAGMYSLFCNEPSKFRLNIVNQWDAEEANAKFKQQLQHHMRYDGSLILSGESISTLNKNELIKLKSFFEGYDIRVICFVRDAYGYQCSAIQEQIKDGIDCLSTIQFRSTASRVSNIKAAFPQTEFYSFEQACMYEGGPVQYFLSLLEINSNKHFIEKKSNEGLGFHSARLLNYINVKQPMLKGGILNPQRKSLNVNSLVFDQNKFLLTKKELETIYPKIAHENARLEKTTGLSFKSKPIKTKEISPPTDKELLTVIRCSANQPDNIKSYISDYLIQNNLITPKQLERLTPNRFITRCQQILKTAKQLITSKLTKNS